MHIDMAAPSAVSLLVQLVFHALLVLVRLAIVTAPTWVPIWRPGSPWGPFSVFGSPLGPHWVPLGPQNLYIFPECSSTQRNWGNQEVEPVGPQVVQQEAVYRQWLPHDTPKRAGSRLISKLCIPTAPTWVPICGTRSPWGPFSVFGSPLGPHWVPLGPHFLF